MNSRRFQIDWNDWKQRKEALDKMRPLLADKRISSTSNTVQHLTCRNHRNSYVRYLTGGKLRSEIKSPPLVFNQDTGVD